MLPLARSNLYYAPKGESAENLRFMELIDKQVLETVAELRHRFEQRWRRYGSRHPLKHTAYALPDSGWHDTCMVVARQSGWDQRGNQDDNPWLRRFDIGGVFCRGQGFFV
jgi:hypothetical protein